MLDTKFLFTRGVQKLLHKLITLLVIGIIQIHLLNLKINQMFSMQIRNIDY